MSSRVAAHEERREPDDGEDGDHGDHGRPASVLLGMRRRAPGDERHAADDRNDPDHLPQRHTLVQDAHGKREDEQQPDRQARLDDHERGVRVGDDLRQDADHAEQQAHHPARPREQPPQEAEPEAERARRDPGVERLQDDPDVEEQRRRQRCTEPEQQHRARSSPKHLPAASEAACRTGFVCSGPGPRLPRLAS